MNTQPAGGDVSEPRTGGASEQAMSLSTSRLAADARMDHHFNENELSLVAEMVLRAAHHPALGLDRSVCLRDVLEALLPAIRAMPSASLEEAAQTSTGETGLARELTDFLTEQFGKGV